MYEVNLDMANSKGFLFDHFQARDKILLEICKSKTRRKTRKKVL
jgi:hypothetical protein